MRRLGCKMCESGSFFVCISSVTVVLSSEILKKLKNKSLYIKNIGMKKAQKGNEKVFK